ncbi:uncharacterized protein BP5553_01189 [Venustampulla echinocandica]|uniref:Uncharacterized protein n=1 Tax=Venustampulla echinocandica TaxID=2656787 RepID=A0A370U0A6_9HELO|nr:uncharacterized protein BP5553_01189 [Venustampulla echinocandica]RDL41210.1 hypothetical protein BP5553_01189 [Venustampulla echinocandica]
MSHQPSTIDAIKATASSTYETITNKFTAQDPPPNPDKDPSNYAQDAHGNTFRKGDLKDQLNAAATGTKPEGQKSGDSLVEKGVTMLQEATFEQGPERNNNSSKNDRKSSTDAPPRRPDNDVQVEEFLRDQYKSKNSKDMSKVGSGKD